MYLLLKVHTEHKISLMQLPTGTGKSLMFDILARYLDLFYDFKVAIVVPTEVLAAI
jgi:superfamily II DNA or RNA helicase